MAKGITLIGITQIGLTQKRHNAKKHNAKRYNANWELLKGSRKETITFETIFFLA